MRPWLIKVNGGPYDGWEADSFLDPAEILIVWTCSPECRGHGAFSPDYPGIVLRTAEAYRRGEVDTEARVAIYEYGDPRGPEVEEEEHEVVGAGAGFLTGGHP